MTVIQDINITTSFKRLLKGDGTDCIGTKIPFRDGDVDILPALNILDDLDILKYEIRDESGKKILLTPELLRGGKKCFLYFTSFDKERLQTLLDKIESPENNISNLPPEPVIKNQSLIPNEMLNTLYYSKSLEIFENSHYRGSLKTKRRQKHNNTKKILATLNFDSSFIDVTFDGKIHRFRKNLRSGDTMKILLVAAYEAGIGKRHNRDELKVHRNLVEVFKNNLFGQNGVLSCFAEISPVSIKIMPSVPITIEQAKCIMEKADEVIDLK